MFSNPSSWSQIPVTQFHWSGLGPRKLHFFLTSTISDFNTCGLIPCLQRLFKAVYKGHSSYEALLPQLLRALIHILGCHSNYYKSFTRFQCLLTCKSKWIKDLTIRTKTIKFQEENMGKSS